MTLDFTCSCILYIFLSILVSEKYNATVVFWFTNNTVFCVSLHCRQTCSSFLCMHNRMINRNHFFKYNEGVSEQNMHVAKKVEIHY